MDNLNIDLSPLHRIILSYAKRKDRERYRFLFAFDARLAEIIRTTSEPLIGQMRLTWWRDMLGKSAADRPEGEPLVSLLNQLEEFGVVSADLLDLIDGWEVLLEDFPWDERQFDIYAQKRGSGYFGFALRQAQLSDDQITLSKIWALWDFAVHCSNAEMRNHAFELCTDLLRHQVPMKFDRSGRPLSILCKLATRDVRKRHLSETMYRPSTAMQIIWHGVTGL